MFKYKRAIILILAILPMIAAAQKSQKEEAALAVRQYSDYLYLHNSAYGSINPTFISGMPMKQLADLAVSYGAGKGAFHNLDKSGDIRDLSVDVYGLKKLRRVSFEGGISYLNRTENNRKWNATLYQADRNPFILADSVASDYSVEKFKLDGRFSWEAASFMRFGINAFYEVGASSDQTDPRPDTRGMRFTVNPGLDFTVSKYIRIGATGGVRLFNETIKYSSVATATNYTFFLMSGMGTFFPQGGAAYTRDSRGTAWFANIQLYWDKPGFANYLQGGLEKNTEKATDGGTTRQFLGGDYRNTKITVKDRFTVMNEKFSHNVELEASSEKTEGIWYYQKSVTENGQTFWVVQSSAVKHKESRLEGNVSYRFDMLKEKLSTITAGAVVGYVNSDTKNFPDNFSQKYSNLSAKLYFTKHINIRHSLLSLTVGGKYNMNLGSSINAEGLPLKDKYTYPIYYYLTSDYYQVYGRAETQIRIKAKRFTSYIGAYLEASTEQYAGKAELYKETHFNTFKGGINYTF